MTNKEILEIVKKAVMEVKQIKQDVISVDAMTHYLDALIKDTEGQESADQKTLDVSLAVFRAEQDAKNTENKADSDHDLELFRSVISFAGAALKSAMLINGGAAVAMMAFIGNIWTQGVSALAVTSLTNSILYFSSGVLAAAVATMTSYFTQYFYLHGPECAGHVFRAFSIIIGIGAFVLFGYGTYEVYTAFFKHLGHENIILPSVS